MGLISEMIGRKYYKLKIHNITKGNKYNVDVSCYCDPNRIYSTNGYGILNGKTQSCGCKLKNGSQITQMIGKKFNRLTIHSRVDGTYMVVASCECNPTHLFEVEASSVYNGRASSCGCLKSEVLITRNKMNSIHNLSQTKIYDVWKQMLRRCENVNCKDYKHYGKKGITVCEEWHDVKMFVNWAYENGYIENQNLSIDRIDSNKGYNPENCEWITCSANIAKRNKENKKVKNK